MRRLLWLDAAMMLTAAALLLADVGAAGLWFAVITLGVCFVIFSQRTPLHR